MTCRYPHKVQHLTEADARAQLKHFKETGHANKKRKNLLHVYRCPDGNHWHVGTDRYKRTRLHYPASIAKMES